MGLNKHREDIDRIDRKLVELLEERLDIVDEIGRYKEENNLPIKDAGREKEKLRTIREMADEERNSYITGIMAEVIRQCRGYQEDKYAKYGLLGRRLGHSFSPEIHKALGGYDFVLYEKDKEELEDFLRNAPYRGICVTIPYKREVMKYCDEITDIARESNSVNVIYRRGDKLIGNNSDYYGFRYMLLKNGMDVKGRKVLVLGNGGVSGTVRKALADMGAEEIVTVSRTGEDNYENISKHHDADVIVNCTPVGMYPKNGKSLVEIEDFTDLKGVVDLVYNPLKTKLVLDAERNGINACGGLSMLVAQAAAAVTMFTGKGVSESEVERCIDNILLKEANIVIIGMPGAGKTSAGKVLALNMDREFVDLDAYIRNKYDASPADIINDEGEEAFRDKETEALREVLAVRNRVVAAGGGIVERDENHDILKENSIVVYLKRDINKLAVKNRPVSIKDGVEAIYDRRHSKYESWSDIKADNVGVGRTASRIARMLEGDKDENTGDQWT